MTRILFFMDLAQDLDLILPLARRAQADGTESETWITDRLARRSPRVLNSLRKEGIPFRTISRFGLVCGFLPPLTGFGALVTASESDARPHRAAHVLTRRARTAGIRTHTLQHGFENIGLTYFDSEYPRTAFASDVIFTWGPLDRLHRQVPAQTRAKCIAAGCPKDPSPGAPPFARPAGFDRTAGVFENLHWKRFSGAYAQRFAADFASAAREFPKTLFLLKPHPDERAAARRFSQALQLPNVRLADPSSPAWEPFTAPALCRIVDAVITTPSTVALDAAQAGCPAAVAAYGIDAGAYAPLTLLKNPEDWIRFLQDPDAERTKSAEFARASLISGDAAGRILSQIAGGDVLPRARVA